MIRWYFDDFGHLKTPTPRSPARHGSRLIFLNTPLLPSEAAFSNWETSKTTTKRAQAYFAGFTSLKGDFKFKRTLVATLTVHVLHVSLCISMYLTCQFFVGSCSFMVFQFFTNKYQEVVQVVACPQVDALVALRKEWMQGLQLRKTAGFDFLNLQLSRLIRRYQNYIKLPMYPMYPMFSILA